MHKIVNPHANTVRKFFQPRSYLLVGITLAISAMTAAMTGCGEGSDSPPSVEALMSIENVGKWYQLFRSDHRGKPPADEESFLAFINAELAERGGQPVTAEALLTSPRDGELYVVEYGKINSNNQELNVVAHERTGVNDTKLLVTELARSSLVDEAELQARLSGK